jgi:death-on-curing family protein
MIRVKRLSVIEVEYIAFNLAREILTYNEPIPEFSTRFPSVLESCLAVPFQSFSRKHFYPTFIKKSAMLFYLMTKNHPFQNGNKRIAITTLLVFLHKNSKWLDVPSVVLYKFSVMVAGSPASDKDKIVLIIEKFLKKFLVGA